MCDKSFENQIHKLYIIYIYNNIWYFYKKYDVNK